ncbi:unnamed protein product [Angiostrongylus costaricensis]|uniref:Uncharacterized protein n=1 Tax=Angiostrongylus costaricensis TaxID=334426 RepID=A0A0R3PV59_ANGCS|nr:unnamed protein product [Angiostrongylus costaricensis]
MEYLLERELLVLRVTMEEPRQPRILFAEFQSACSDLKFIECSVCVNLDVGIAILDLVEGMDFSIRYL